MSLVTDSIAHEDLLGRGKFAKQIVNSLHQSFSGSHEGVVVGISGGWGSGKSTLLKYVENNVDELNKEPKTNFQVLNFNSWGNSGKEFRKNFLQSILDTVSQYKWKKPVKEAEVKLKSYLKYLQYIKFLKHLHPTAKSILEGIDDFIDPKEVVSLEDIRDTVNELLVNNGLKLFILIDDLDRLTPKEITSLFKVLKVNLNLSNTFFIIAYDKQVVVDALSNEYGFDGEKYLEKIIQIDFSTPQIIQEQIERIFFDKLTRYFNQIKIDFNQTDLKSIWRIHGFKEFFKTIRDINRYFNNLIFSLPNIGKDVNVQDFLLIEAVRTFDNSAYNGMYSNVLLIKRKAIWESVKIDESFINAYQSETTRSILKVLFVRDYGNKQGVNEKRLRDPNFFERYFSLNVSNRDIAEDNMDSFFVYKSDKKTILNNIYETGKMPNFLERIANAGLNKTFDHREPVVFKSILDFWDNKADPIEASYGKLIFKAYFNMIELFDDKFKAAQVAIRNLILKPSSNLRLSFVLYYYIHIDLSKSQGYNDYGQIDNIKNDLITSFLKYLEAQIGSSFLRIKGQEAEWIDFLFLTALSRFKPKLYLKEHLKNLEDPIYLYFIIKNFLLYDDEGIAGSLSLLDNLKQLFPENSLTKIVLSVDSLPANKLNAKEYQNLKFFAKEVIIRDDLDCFVITR